jgi:hypothetical protein
MTTGGMAPHRAWGPLLSGIVLRIDRFITDNAQRHDFAQFGQTNVEALVRLLLGRRQSLLRLLLIEGEKVGGIYFLRRQFAFLSRRADLKGTSAPETGDCRK